MLRFFIEYSYEWQLLSQVVHITYVRISNETVEILCTIYKLRMKLINSIKLATNPIQNAFWFFSKYAFSFWAGLLPCCNGTRLYRFELQTNPCKYFRRPCEDVMLCNSVYWEHVKFLYANLGFSKNPSPPDFSGL